MRKLTLMLVLVLLLCGCSRQDALPLPGETTQTDASTTASATESDIYVMFWSEQVQAGETATVKIQGDPNTVYTIQAFYSSGASSAKGLEPKTSDENGIVSWSWKVSANVSPGRYRIRITGGGQAVQIGFDVK